MKKVAVVVQRCHESVVGGSESLAWQYANLLKEKYQSEVITTTAVSTSDWANALPAGEETRDAVVIRRFPVTVGRRPYWGKLHQRLLSDFKLDRVGNGVSAQQNQPLRWGLSLQDEFVRTQGPYSEGLLNYLNRHWADYETIIFVTYLYATSYFGILQVPPNFALFAPTLHNEEPAYLSGYRHAAHRAKALIWLTDAEQKLGHRLWGNLPGRVIGMNIDTEPRSPARSKAPFVLYCGRIDPNKGCIDLFDYFTRFKKEYPSNLRLVLVGKDDIPVPSHVDIDFRGFVSSEEKFSLMAGATAFVMPSRQESFSIVTLEAMAQGTPVLASGRSAVICDHITNSGGGYVYGSYEDFADKLNSLISGNDTAAMLGDRGRAYVTTTYKLERVRADLIGMVESCSTYENQSA